MLGQRLHNFAIIRLLGEGGMSSVYEAEHELIRRKVAVKVLRSELSVDGAQVQRFFNEARATSAIRHPNIVEVIDVGRLPDGVPYLVMELLEGESLAQRLERLGSLDIPLALDFAHQAASALEAAHALNVVHRDLKPDNLFLVPDQRVTDRELVKVLDFGIAKLRGELAAPPFDTLVGALLGTPPYMSPEQCRGLPEEIDERTDVYALGIILYEMICGRPPFVADGAGELMMLHMTEAPEPPSLLCPEIPEALELAILRALAKKREERWGSMAELNAELAAIADTLGVWEPVPARRSSPSLNRVSVITPAGIAAEPPRADESEAEDEFESDTTLTALKIGPGSDLPRASLSWHAPAPATLERRRHAEGAADSGIVALSAERATERDSGIIAPGALPLMAADTLEASAEGPWDEDTETTLAEVPNIVTAAPGPPRRRWIALALIGGSLGAVAVTALVSSGIPRQAPETARLPARAPEASPEHEPPPVSLTASERPREAPIEPSEVRPGTQPVVPSETPTRRETVAAPPEVAPVLQQPTAAARAAATQPRRAVRPPPRRAPPPPPPSPVRTEEVLAAAPPRPPRPLPADREPRVEVIEDTPSLQPKAASANTAPAIEIGYLNLDSSPWSDVFIGPERLGTTPLMRVPLPPGRHVLTLRNPELGASTSYAVEIVPGKTVSRLVGWEHR